MTAHKVAISIDLVITDQDLDDILVAAFEGGINYWCSETVAVSSFPKGTNYASEAIAAGATGTLTVDEYDPSTVTLNREKLLAGIDLAFKTPGVRSQMISAVDGEVLDCSCIDAGLADTIVQLAVFGELVFC